MAPIHNAAQNGNLNRVKALLNQGVPVNSRNEAGWTPLHDAAYRGHLSVVQELLRRGAHVNPRSISGYTPLHVAALEKHPHVVHALIRAGANPKYGNMYGHLAHNIRHANKRSIPNALKTSRAVTKWQNFHKKSIARKRAPNKNLAEKVFSPKRVKSMMNKYGFNWLNKV